MLKLFLCSPQDTDAGILKDDLQQLRMFQAAMGLVTKSVDERRLELSDKVQSLLSDMTNMIWRVVMDYRFFFLPFIFFSWLLDAGLNV